MAYGKGRVQALELKSFLLGVISNVAKDILYDSIFMMRLPFYKNLKIVKILIRTDFNDIELNWQAI